MAILKYLPTSAPDRIALMAFSCLPALICGIAITRPATTMDRGLFVWFVFVVAAGVILGWPETKKIRHAFEEALPSSLAFAATVTILLTVTFILGQLGEIKLPSYLSGIAIVLPVGIAIGLVLLCVLILLFAIATSVVVTLCSLASIPISLLVEKVSQLNPTRLKRLDLVIKAIAGIIGSLFVLWVALLG